MICSGNDCSKPNFLQQLNTVKLNNSFLERFLNDILFWEQETTDLWAHPYGSKKRRKKAGEKVLGEKSNGTHSRQTTRDDEIDEITINALSNSNWKTANDPRTGRPYYYHSKTRVTQWQKPAEVKALEKKIRQEKKRQDAKFFREMEQNLHKSIGRGELIPGIGREEITNQSPPLKGKETSPQRKHVRTISRMDANISFEELGDDRGASRIVPKASRHTGPLHQQTLSARQLPWPDHPGKPPLPKMPTVARTNSMELSPEEEKREHKIVTRVDSGVSLAGESLLDAPLQSTYDVSELNMPPNMRSQAQTHARRNTGGTIFLENTMTRPDIHATIKCVCGVYRRHILQGVEQQITGKKGQYESRHNMDMFLDYRTPSPRQPEQRMKVPTLSEVLAFYKEFFVRSKMEHDTIIMSLIYVERLVKTTDGQLNPNPDNWRSILFACMVLASKVWDDLSMWNVDFSNVSTNTDGLFSFSLRRINELELHLLKSLKFDVRVGASEYAKYYFLIRSMLIRSGLVQESERPLRKTEAFQKLEAKTNTYQVNQLNAVGQKDRRSKSMDDSFWRSIATNAQSGGPVFSDSVCLEQIIASNR
ncbi:unnamed protein product [Cylindrotheca closterium]|uniref:WW domain-containing protein n=1 Tax=Cylindrotheca closterium TaxID=2856 RepID=A0AAD2CPG8_9STRA|nr:unnamed protein product [Cylindrotheca closterium]